MSLIKLAWTAREARTIIPALSFISGFTKGSISPGIENMNFGKSVGIGAGIAAIPGGYFAIETKKALPILIGVGALSGATANIGARLGRSIAKRIKNEHN